MTRTRYGLRSPDSPDGRSGASLLIERMYAWRGYQAARLDADDPHRITLTASDRGEVVGTLTIGIDAGRGLMADHMYKEELDALRRQGARLAEVTKLAFDHSVQSKHALASVFHLAFIYAREMHGCTDAVIEVNPRHRRFYEAMLGFQTVCESRPNPRVQAPAVLLRVDTAFGTEQVAKWGGMQDKAVGERSLFPWFFSPREEAGIVNRLRQLG